VKRPLALLTAAVVVVVAWLGARAIDGNRERTVRREAGRAAETAGMRASDALAAHWRRTCAS
jgi:hypothetical protein